MGRVRRAQAAPAAEGSVTVGTPDSFYRQRYALCGWARRAVILAALIDCTAFTSESGAQVPEFCGLNLRLSPALQKICDDAGLLPTPAQRAASPWSGCSFEQAAKMAGRAPFNDPCLVHWRSIEVRQHPERAADLECMGIKAYEDPQPPGHPVPLAECERRHLELQQRMGITVLPLSDEIKEGYRKTWGTPTAAAPSQRPTPSRYCIGFSAEACARIQAIVEAKVRPKFCAPGFPFNKSLTDEQLRACYVRND